MTLTRMCDKSTRVWCCRIMLVFSVLGVLCTMLFQIWSYYFSLVKQMDDQTISRPQVLAFVHACENVKYVWNSKCVKSSLRTFMCTIFNPEDSLYYIDQAGMANVSLSSNSIRITDLQDCVRLTVWAIPW